MNDYKTDWEPATGRIDCQPIPTDRNQGWPGVYAVLYTDSINDEQTSRDDLWIATTAAIKAVIDKAQTDAYAEGRKDEAEQCAWQSIETAPEDEHILIATTGGHVGTAYWTDEGDGKVWAWGHAERDGGQCLHANLTPLAWMPLPAHPGEPEMPTHPSVA